MIESLDHQSMEHAQHLSDDIYSTPNHLKYLEEFVQK